jgi:hypothetical protein
MILYVKELVVKAPKQNCPRCNAQQSFRLRHRDTEGRPGVIEVFIKCTVCMWESVLRKSTKEIELLTAQERRLKEQARIQQERHGTVNGATERLLRNVTTVKARAREEAGL